MKKTFYVGFFTMKFFNVSISVTKILSDFLRRHSELTFSWCLLGDADSLTNVCEAHISSVERIL